MVRATFPTENLSEPIPLRRHRWPTFADIDGDCFESKPLSYLLHAKGSLTGIVRFVGVSP